MVRTWGLLLWPRGAPLWLALLGNLSLAIVILAAALVFLPHDVVGRSKLLRRLRSKLLKQCRRVMELSKEGPFYRLFVWCGRRCSGGRLSTACRPPSAVGGKASGYDEVSITWSPCLPNNPFHEERYVLSSRKVGRGPDGVLEEWQERLLNPAEDCQELAGHKLRSHLDGLAERTLVSVRLCAVNAWGRSEWSEEVQMETLARPNDDGGFTGPLGPAAGEAARSYRWSQTSSEVGLKVPIAADRRGRDIKFKALSTRLEIRCVVPEGQPDELLVGPLHKRIKADEATWEIDENKEDGRHIVVQLPKADTMQKWPCLIDADGHPRIDTKLVRLFTKGMGMGMGGLDIFE